MKQASTKQKLAAAVMLVVLVGITVTVFVFREQFAGLEGLGLLGLFLICLLANATVLLPAPSTLAVVGFAQLFNPVAVGVVGGLGAAVGEFIGYLAGRSTKTLLEIDHKRALFEKFMRRPLLWVFLFALIPWPVFDVIGIMAGIANMPPLKFFIACALGKVIKMLAFSLLSAQLGALAMNWSVW